MPFWVINIIQINQTASYLMNEVKSCNKKWVLLQSVEGELSVHDQLFRWHQHWGSLHGVTRKLDLDQTSMAHTERHKCDKTHFSVRPHDFLHPSAVNSASNVVIMFVLVCLCRFIWQIILLTYMSYKLVANFDVFHDDFWISSHCSLTIY